MIQPNWRRITARFVSPTNLYGAVGSIGANLAEGYSMGTGKNRARYYEYALGSARESRDWYNKGRHVLSETIVEHRMGLLAEIIKLLLTMVPQQRQSAIREEPASYEIVPDQIQPCTENDENRLDILLQNVLLP
jgi:four helix bundle protein